jgi:hypothetical protein
MQFQIDTSGNLRFTLPSIRDSYEHISASIGSLIDELGFFVTEAVEADRTLQGSTSDLNSLEAKLSLQRASKLAELQQRIVKLQDIEVVIKKKSNQLDNLTLATTRLRDVIKNLQDQEEKLFLSK